MNVLMLGGVRFSGKAILEELSNAGHDITVLTRGNLPVLQRKNIKPLSCDRRNAADLQSKLSNLKFDLIFDNNAYSKSDIEILFSIKGLEFKHYFFTSTAWVYKLSEAKAPYSEELLISDSKKTSLHAQTLEYLEGKIACERFIQNNCTSPYSILRPGIILGEEDHTLRSFFYLFRILDGNEFILMNGGKNSFTPVYSRDFARAVKLLIEGDLSKSEILNIVSDCPVTPEEMVIFWSKLFEKKTRSISISRDIVKQKLSSYYDNEPFCNEIDQVYSSSKLKKRIGIEFTPISSVLTSIAKYYLNNIDNLKSSSNTAIREKELNLINEMRAGNAFCSR